MAIPTCHVVFMLDESGSMKTAIPDTIKAYNQFVTTLQNTKGAVIRFTLWRFGWNCVGEPCRKELDAVPIQDVPMLNKGNYAPHWGREALYDSAMRIIADAEKSNHGRVVLVIQCDGGDDSSLHYRAPAVARSLNNKIATDGWQAMFLGTVHNHRSWSDLDRARVRQKMLDVAASLGFPNERILAYGGDSKVSAGAFSAAALSVSAYASTRSDKAVFSDEAKKQAGG